MTDQQIIQLYWARSEEAIAATAAAYGSYCTSIAYNILHSREDSEECVSDTWHRAWQSIPPQRPNPLRVWLGRITRNLALDRWRADRADKRGGGQADLLLSELEHCIPAPASPQRQAEDGEVIDSISRFLRAQSPTARAAFLRRYWYGESIGDIAAALHMGKSAVKSALHRTREGLRDHLEQEGLWL